MPRRYIVALVIIAIIFFFGVWLLVSLVTGGKPDENNPGSPVTPAVVKTLPEDAASVTYGTYGPVVAEEDYRVIRITINESERTAEILQGYNLKVIKIQTRSNTEAAFKALLEALAGAGYTNYNSKSTVVEGTVCTTGKRYTYEASFMSKENYYSWGTSCSSKQGNFQGNPSLVKTLMQDQIPNYSEFVEGVKM